MKELSFCRIILEAKYEADVTRLSRPMVNFFKTAAEAWMDSGKGRKWISQKFTVKSISTPGLKIKVDFQITFMKHDKKVYTCQGILDPKKKDILIILKMACPADAKVVSPTLVAKLKGTLRHEIEHLDQALKGVDLAKAIRYDPTKLADFDKAEIYKYFTTPVEIDALVAGSYKDAKTRKVPLFKILLKRTKPLIEMHGRGFQLRILKILVNKAVERQYVSAQSALKFLAAVS